MKKAYCWGLAFSYLVVFGICAIRMQTSWPGAIQNFRLLFSHKEINQLVQTGFSKKTVTPDDPGFLAAYALGAKLEDRTVGKTTDTGSFPLSYKLFLIALHMSFVTLLCFAGSVLHPVTIGIALLFFLSPNFLDLFAGFDVYVFPVYAAIMGIYSLHLKRSGGDSGTKSAMLSLGTALTELFRKKSLILYLPGFFLNFRKSTHRQKAILMGGLIFAVLLTRNVTNLVFESHGHAVWHPLHAGLFEYGGCLDKAGNPYPYYLFEREKLAKQVGMDCSEHWNDLIQYEAAARNGIKEPYSSEYSEFLRKQFMEIVTKAPGAYLSLMLMRLMNALNWNVFKDHYPTGAFPVDSPLGLVLSLSFILIALLWAMKNPDKEKTLLLFSMLILALPPALLVHSSHVIYNLPTNFIQFLIIGEAVALFYKSRKFKSKAPEG